MTAVREREDRAYGGILRDAQGRICLVRPVGRGLWALPKGHADPGESPEDAALREVREETGFSPRLGAYVGHVAEMAGLLGRLPEERRRGAHLGGRIDRARRRRHRVRPIPSAGPGP